MGKTPSLKTKKSSLDLKYYEIKQSTMPNPYKTETINTNLTRAPFMFFDECKYV